MIPTLLHSLSIAYLLLNTGCTVILVPDAMAHPQPI